jgi:hypothetical protein
MMTATTFFYPEWGYEPEGPWTVIVYGDSLMTFERFEQAAARFAYHLDRRVSLMIGDTREAILVGRSIHPSGSTWFGCAWGFNHWAWRNLVNPVDWAFNEMQARGDLRDLEDRGWG